MINSLISVSVLCTSLLMHPVHETVCEVQWNAKTKRVEVALRLDSLDEQWIEKHSADDSADADSDGDTNADWRSRFLSSQILFDPTVNKRLKSRVTGRPIKWMGRKEDGGHVWWFFEVICDDGKPPTAIQIRLLFDQDSSYQHRIIMLGQSDKGTQSHSVVLTERKPKSPLRLTP